MRIANAARSILEGTKEIEEASDVVADSINSALDAVNKKIKDGTNKKGPAVISNLESALSSWNQAKKDAQQIGVKL